MSPLKKIFALIPEKKRRSLLVLGFLMLFGLIFEILGIGLIIPIIAFISDPNFINDYPVVKKFLEFFGTYNENKSIIILFTFLVIFFVFRSFFLVYVAWKQNQFSGAIYEHLSNYFFDGYLNCDYPFHLKNNSAPMIKNIQVEVELMGSVINTTLIFLGEFIVALSIVILLFIVQPFGALITTVFFITASYLYNKFFKNKLSSWGEQRVFHLEKRTQVLIEGFGGIKEIKLFSAKEFFLNKFNFHSKTFAKVAIKSGTVAQIPRLYLELLAVIALAISIVFIVSSSNGDKTEIFILMGIYVAAAFRILPSINRMMSSFQSIRYLFPLVNKLVAEKKVIDDNKKNNRVIVTNKSLEFKKLIEIDEISYSYDDTEDFALNNISFSFKKGEFIGIMGKSGSGKSTFVDIFMGLFAPKSGNIKIDGKILEDFVSWRSKIGYVPQNIYLIDNTIANNIAFGIPSKKIDMNRVNYVLKEAQLFDFIHSLPLSTETMVGERGVRLSGGQRQRLGIARALYHNPEILVLDESTSALDNLTEKGIMDSILNLKKNTTVIFVTHRLNTIKECDQVFKMEKGSIKKISKNKIK
ncbi:MAG: ABC transporter ATP-binding protein [Flavobacteriaceae bacterium]|jgi:ATP-binding cassette, subfamily B, bacterial PglK|nr:ABC transporter ATP-binding protein [Flavobacteriaceae bacterium]